MAKVKQFTVVLENRPGTLAHMAKVLADAKVNVHGGSAGVAWLQPPLSHFQNKTKIFVDRGLPFCRVPSAPQCQ